MLYQGVGCFFWGIINHYTRLYFLECRDSLRVFNFHVPFCSSGETDYVDLAIYISCSLRFEYLVSVLDMSFNWEIRRESCLFLSFFSESETISCWWSGAGQIKISFVAIPKYLQTLHQQKILKTFYCKDRRVALKDCQLYSNYLVLRPPSYIYNLVVS